MSATLIGDVTAQVKTMWSDLFMDELLQSTILAALVNKDYEGEIRQKGDTVRVSQINRAQGTRKTVGSGHESFETEQLSTQYVDIVADQVITAAYEFDSLVELQSQIGDQDSKIRQGLLEALEIEVNNFLYSLVSPSTANPDHVLTGVADFNATQLSTIRKLAAQARWRQDGGWWCLVDPSYQSDLLNATTLVSKDYVEDMPIVGGQMAQRRFGFNVLEDNSDGILTLGTDSEDFALAFHPDFLHYVAQKEPTFEVSSLHSQKKHGNIISVTMVCGAKIGNDGDVKHITVQNN
jgi:hypothetical protein